MADLASEHFRFVRNLITYDRTIFDAFGPTLNLCKWCEKKPKPSFHQSEPKTRLKVKWISSIQSGIKLTQLFRRFKVPNTAKFFQSSTQFEYYRKIEKWMRKFITGNWIVPFGKTRLVLNRERLNSSIL